MIDTDEFSKALRANARLVSRGQCAKYLRLALAAGGVNTQGHPSTAKSYGPLLGFWPGPVYRKEKPAYVVYRP
jgi:hypothetical protein